MDTLITLSYFLILGLIVISPIITLIILKKLRIKQTLILYSLIGLATLGVLILFFAWWSYKSDLILLKHFGYNIDGMNYTEFYGNVSPHNMEKVKSIETSIMGIGWQVKAFFGYLVLIPYLVFVYIGKILFQRLKNKKNEA